MVKVTAGGKNTNRRRPDPGREIEELRDKVRELEQTLDAIRSGEVDAIIVAKGDAQRIYTLEGADHPYQILVENIQEGVLTLSRAGMILYTNTQFAAMVKVPLEELPGTSFLDYICPEYCLVIDDALRAIQTRDFKGRALIRHGSSSLPVMITMASLSPDENTTISVVITDRSLDEEQIRFQAQILNAVGDAVIAIDADGKIIYWNDAATKTYGWKPAEVMGRDLVDVTLPNLSKKETREIGRYLKKGEVWSGEYRVRHRDGHPFPIYASAAPVFDTDKNLVAVISASHDITEKKKIEEILKESEDRYRTVADFTLDWEFWIDPDGNYKYISPSAERVLGRSVKQILSAEELFRACMHPEDLENRLAHMVQEKTGQESFESEFRIMRPDGEIRWIHHVCQPIWNKEGKFLGTRGSNRDITDRKQIEEALFESEKKYRIIFETANEGIWITDAERKTILINQRMADLLGYPVKEVLGRTPSEFLGSGQDLARQKTSDDLKRGESTHKEFKFRRKDGSDLWVISSASPVFDSEGRYLRTVSLLADITDRKLAEEALKKSEEEYRHLVKYAPAAIYEISSDGNHFRYVNDAMCHILGYTQAELLEMNPFNILDEESRVRFQERVRKRLASEDIDESVAYRIFGRDGREIWATLNIRLNHEKERGTLVVAHDITERKRTELALQTTLHRLHTLVSSMNVGTLLVENDRVELANQTFCDYFELKESPDDLVGIPDAEMIKKIRNVFLHPDEEVNHIREIVKRGKQITGEKVDIRGNRTYLRDFVPVIVDGNMTGRLWYHVDITDITRAEQMLRESHKRITAILEGVADTFYSLDTQWRFTTVNPAAEKAPFGRPATELLGKVIWELYPALVGTRIHQHYLDAAKKHSLEYYEARSPLNGRWYEVFMQGREEGVDVYMRDITVRKQIEEDLRQSEKRYKELVENANSMIIKMDNEGKISFFNDYAQNFFGYSPDEILGKNVNILVPLTESTTGRSLDTMVHAVLKDPDNFAENVNENVKKNGDRVWISWRNSAIRDSCGNITGNLAFGQDITVRRKAEDALRESEARFRLALRNAPVSVAIQDRDLVFQWAYNQRTIRPEEIKGKKDTDIFTPEDAARLIELKHRCLETGKIVQEKIWMTMNGRQLFLDLYLEPLRDEKGQITGIGIATVDLTEQKLTEEMLRFSEENLLQAQELLEAVTKGTDVIIAVQDKNFRYIYFNQAYKEVIKRLTGEDLSIGTSMIELFAGLPEEQNREIKEWSKVLAGEQVNETIAFGDPGSHRRIYHVLHTPLRDSQGTIIAAGEVAFDITRQAQVEEALRETKEYLDNLITYANAPIIVWDPQFRITLFNHAFEHLTGRKAKDVKGKQLDILLPGDYLEEGMNLIRKTMVGERWESVEIPILHKKGGIRTVLWNSASVYGSDGKTIVSTIAQGQDITDRKKVESKIRQQAAEYAKMNVVLEEEIRQRKISDATLKNTLSLLNASLESTADGILVVDQKGKITSFNKNFMNMWNISEEVLESGYHQTVINHVLPQLKNPEGYLTGISELEVHPGRESFDMVEFNDGKIFERYSKPQKIGNTVVGRVWSYRDITDRRRAEEDLLASVHEKEVLLREIHHRVKNNLQLISGLLDMTRMRTVDESTNTILTDLMLKIQTMAQIHTRLYESKQFGKISLTGQIRDQVTALSNIYSHKGHEIICELDALEIFLPVDQAIPCALVVNEILSNAYKHAFKGRKHGTIEISAVQENGQIRITVRDDGIGIPDNFDISRTNSLGLKLIRTLVQSQLKGSLMFMSRNGTEVTMEFPVITGGT